jgi:hypothetical protein
MHHRRSCLPPFLPSEGGFVVEVRSTKAARLARLFVLAGGFLASSWLSSADCSAQFGGTGATGGFGGAGGANGNPITGGLGAAANANSLLNAVSSNSFSGFTQNFGSGNTPFSTGASSLNNSGNGIGSLAGSGFGRTGATGVGGLGGGTGIGGATGGVGGLGGATGVGGFGGGGLTGGIGGGLGGIGGGLGGIGGGLGGIGGRGGLGGGIGGFGGGLGGIGGMNQGGLGGGRFGGGMNQNQTRSAVKMLLKPQVQVTPLTAPQKTAQVQGRLSRLRLPEQFRNVQVTVDGRKAIVSGQVNSAADLEFISRLLKLEPGIDAVESRLSLASPPAEMIQATPIP